MCLQSGDNPHNLLLMYPICVKAQLAFSLLPTSSWLLPYGVADCSVPCMLPTSSAPLSSPTQDLTGNASSTTMYCSPTAICTNVHRVCFELVHNQAYYHLKPPPTSNLSITFRYHMLLDNFTPISTFHMPSQSISPIAEPKLGF